MDKRLSILLVEDDKEACKAIQDYIDELDDISLVGIVNNSNEALECVKNYLPEAIILDLELHQGSGNGLLFLNELKKEELPFYPFVLITTNNSSAVIYDYARQLGADFIMAKHQEDYSPKKVVDFLRIMKNSIQSKISSKAPEHNTTEAPEQRMKRIVRRISLELDYIGISPKHVGYKYLSDAIQLVIKGPTNKLCTIIGTKYGKTEFSVERAMQNAIDKAWRTSDIEDLLEHYTAKISSDKGTPTLTEFVYYYANKIKNEY
ncbi:MAG: sporulation initiation factor Spo0A C-terminal domain-containing protein [Angelakisella sp.]|nr:sporulation initiation factor Spo0A C-terminal domain-containing protein [Angelakisella sp.]